MNLEIFLDENMQRLANISYSDVTMLVKAELGADPRAVELRHENGSGGEQTISFQKLVKHVKLNVETWMRCKYDCLYDFVEGDDDGDDGGDEGDDGGGDEDDGGDGHSHDDGGEAFSEFNVELTRRVRLLEPREETRARDEPSPSLTSCIPVSCSNSSNSSSFAGWR